MTRRATWLLVTALGCGPSAPPPGGDRTRLVATAAPGDEVVAEVDGVPIHASQIAAQARAAGVDARAALSALIDAEVVAGAALRARLDDEPDVRQATRAAEVRRLLARDFEHDTPTERIPEADLRKLYAINKLRFDHDEAREVWHILARAPSASASAEAKARARAALEQILPRAMKAPTDEAFTALAVSAPGGPELKAERLSFPRHGVVEEPFAEAAFALREPGATSGLVETSYGYHVIRLIQVVPARHVDEAGAREELAPAALLGWRKAELERWMRGIVERTHVEVYTERLPRTASGGP